MNLTTLIFVTLSTGFNILDTFLSRIIGVETFDNQSQNYTISRDACGVSPVSCPESTYRSLDGSCNNLQHPSWGTPNTPYTRLLPSTYGDGIYSFPTSKSGRPLLSAREISLLVYKNTHVRDPKWTLNNMQWGQLMVHDMSLTTGVLPPSPRCCVDGKDVGTDPRCANIHVPLYDVVHLGQKCLNFLRTVTTKDNNCTAKNVPAEPLTAVTSYMDASFVYGNTNSDAKSLRTMKCGKMKAETRNGQEWPPQEEKPTQSCNVETDSEPCYMAGDKRVNQNTELSMLQVIFLRKHNKIADYLCEVNKQWSDEKIYQESRRIIIACFQHVNYNELLPIYLGRDNMLKRNLIRDNPVGYVNDYNPNINPGVSVEHASVAFRFFHSAIYGSLQMFLEDRVFAGEIQLSSWMNKPSILEEGSNFANFARGVNTQPEMAMDGFFDKEIINYLFRGNKMYGSDLRATDIQRARDHGVPTYNDLRNFCGLPKAKKFIQFTDHIPKEHVDKLSKIYETPDDVEAAVAGTFEKTVNGTLFGPTYLCILLEQFYRTRTGDRYFYESGNYEGALTLKQLESIRRGATVASLFCEVSGIKSIQRKALELISDTNPVVPCEQIPTPDLSLWQEI